MSACLLCDPAAGRAEPSVVGELDDELGAHLFRVAKQLASALRATDVRCDGVNLFLSDGAAAGEGGWQQASRPELDRVAPAIREAVAA